MTNLLKEKVLIQGSDSFLGKSFANYLESKSLQVLRVCSANSNNYELESLERLIKENNPKFFFDYQFKLVSSKNSDYEIYDKHTFFNAQNNLISILNKTNENNKKVYLFSSRYVEDNKSTYSDLKLKQENIYKSLLNKNIFFEVFRLNTVLGIGDKNINRAIPHFFYSIFNFQKAVFESTGSQPANFSFIDDVNWFVYKKVFQSENVVLNNFSCTYFELIQYISNYIIENFDYEHSVEWAEGWKGTYKFNVSDEVTQNIHKTVNWYFENMEEIKLLNG
jgi:nucleoside-diphosphate-sugar epimerase